MEKSNRKYHINPQTLAFERVEHGFIYWLKRSGIDILLGILLGLLFFYIFFSFFPSAREKQLMDQRDRMEVQLKVVDKQLDQMQLVLTDLQQRDDNLYRVLFGAEPIPMSVRMSSVNDQRYYEELQRMTNSQLTADVALKADILEKEVYTQAKSYEDILEMAKTSEIRMENIPAIQPVLNKDLTRVASGYGIRIDPIYHVRKFHAGMDFTAPTGTEIYATGNGVVSFSGWRQGYGMCVTVDHGFGYTTLYAHLYKSMVRPGQKVHRGDVIALVGNTGKSTGPHLHYEVRINDKPVDPRNYYFYDLSPEEYDKMVQLSNNYGNMLD